MYTEDFSFLPFLLLVRIADKTLVRGVLFCLVFFFGTSRGSPSHLVIVKSSASVLLCVIGFVNTVNIGFSFQLFHFEHYHHCK